MTAQDITRALFKKFEDSKYMAANIYFFRSPKYNETDFLVLNKSGYLLDVEIKVSLQDYKKDFTKIHKHHVLKNRGYSEECPNRFYYAVPTNLITVDDLPEYAGLYYIDEAGFATKIKEAPLLHKGKIDCYERLCNKFYWGYREAQRYRDNDTYRELKSQVNNLFKTVAKLQEDNRVLRNSNMELISENRPCQKV